MVGLLAAATFALAGCGGADEDAGTPTAAAGGATTVGADAAGTGTETGGGGTKGGYADEGYACGLLTRADVEKLFGGKVGQPEPTSVGNSRFCQWKDGTSESWVYLEISKPSKGAAAEYDELRKVRTEAKDISGLGEKANSYYVRGETHVRVLVRDMYIKVAVQYLKARTLTPEDDVARVTTLARQVVGRM